ncbi:hypothetical protein [Isoptericola sp. NPDC056605]|uniref:hypothetical protein n=1 Tax=Isoptericola sp. NPDC056605 TaxID=3345876 RepID=UPI00369BB194
MSDDDYTFRLRFRLAGPAIGHDAPEYDLGASAGLDEGRVVLRSAGGDTPIAGTRELCLLGRGFATEHEAEAAAGEWEAALQVGFAAARTGADFGVRTAPMGHLTQAGTESLGPAARDEHLGVHTYESASPPAFVAVSAEAQAVVPISHLAGAVRDARHRGPDVDEKMRTSYAMYSAALTLSDPDARFMMLMTAYEVLVIQRPRSPEAREHLDALAAQTAEAAITDDEREAIRDGLGWLKHQSISSAGRDLADTLGDREYDGRSPRKFFTYAYNVRSKLVHGDAPPRDEVTRLAGVLAHMVGDLLSLRPEVAAPVETAAPK